MNRSPAIMILDDDPVFLKILSLRIKKRFPDLSVQCQNRPVAIGVFDIYILDNDFHGHPLAAELVELIKEQQPDSLVLALSATLCNSTLKRLINCGCDGAFDKTIPGEIDMLISLIQDHVENSRFVSNRSLPAQTRVLETARAISGLIQDWNNRLTLEERRKSSEQETHNLV